jgi:pantothenate kinase-related protein Tda10
MSDLAAPNRQAGVLISGAFGTGKSSTAEEMATIIEARGLANAAIDLDDLRRARNQIEVVEGARPG